MAGETPPSPPLVSGLWSSAQNLLATLQIVSLFIKIVIFIFFFMWVRWTIPRFRYDQLMRLGWKILIPLALFNMLVTGFLVLLHQNNWRF